MSNLIFWYLFGLSLMVLGGATVIISFIFFRCAFGLFGFVAVVLGYFINFISIIKKSRIY